MEIEDGTRLSKPVDNIKAQEEARKNKGLGQKGRQRNDRIERL